MKTRKTKAKCNNWKEPVSGIVHIKIPIFCGGEYTLCGDAFDRPSTEDDQMAMVESDEVCNCKKCIEIAEQLQPILKTELRRIEARGEARSFG